MSPTIAEPPEQQPAAAYARESDERAGVVTDIPLQTRTPAIAAVGVVGAGTMGTGICLCCLDAGLPTVLVDLQPGVLASAQQRIGASYERAVAKGRLSAAQAAQRLALLRTSVELGSLGDADLIIEAVFEDLSLKQNVFRAIEPIATPEAILASNTSTLDVNRIAAVTSRTAQTLGLHFFSPANVMRLLEIVRAAHTSPATLMAALSFAKRIGKTAVVTRVCDGFIGNRMMEEYLRQAYFLLDEGATPLQVDEALEQWGMAMGPFSVMDLAGGDIGWAIRKRRAQEQPGRPYSGIPDRICELGRFGQKSGAGYYRYEGRTRIVDPQIEALIVAYSHERGIRRRPVSDEEIVGRCILALVNEGARVLGEGIAQRGSDIDVVYRHGYGFPADRGGPLFHADQMGLTRVLEHMAEFRKGYQGWAWEPAPLLLEFASRGARLSSEDSRP